VVSPGLCLGEQPRTHFRARPTGVGKSYVASALGTESLPRWLLGLLLANRGLFRDLNLARADGSLRQLLSGSNRIDV